MEPSVLCDDSPTSFRIHGEGLDFAVVNALEDDHALVPPAVTLTPSSGLAAGTPPLVDTAVVVPAERVHTSQRDVLEIDVDPALGLAEGAWDVAVDTGDGGHAVAKAALVVAGAPVITGFESDQVCQVLPDALLSVLGTGFLQLDGSFPAVAVGGAAAGSVVGGSCEPLAGSSGGQVCTRLDVTFDATSLAFGGVPVSLTNPAPAACSAERNAAVEVVAPPGIDSIAPAATCVAAPGTAEVKGFGFVPGMSVEIGSVPATDVAFVDDTTLEVTPSPGTPLGLDDVAVIAPSGCEDVLEGAFEVVDAPLVLAADPPIVWNGADLGSRILLTDVVGTVTDAWLEDPQGARVDVGWSWDPATPGSVDLVVPAGLDAGFYGVGVAQDGSCDGVLDDAIEVVADLDVAVDSVDPAFAWSFDFTPVAIHATDPIPAGMLGFEDTPRVVLIGPKPASDAIPLLGVSFRSETELTAVVPDGLDVGSYDVLVANPDGSLGLLADGVVVTFDAPPRIDSVSPPAIPNSGDQPATILGGSFRDPAVYLDCAEGGVVTTVAATVTSWTAVQVDVLVPTGGFTQAVCVVRVVDADGAATAWSAVSITNPAQNLFPWQTGPSLVVPRRAPAAAAGRTTSVQRWVYAIGGDAGDASSAMSSIEVASVGVYGDIGAFSLLSQGLPARRTLAASATIGRFVYLVGGNDGTGPVNTVWRAQILDPLQVPFFTDVEIVPGNGAGLGGGKWTWRVSALYDPTFASNPGGESLPSESLTLTLPDVAGQLEPVLSWTAVDGATGYRVYRSPNADLASGQEEWVADVIGATTFTDLGDATDSGTVPLASGALGAWGSMPDLAFTRESPCVAVAPDPFPDPDEEYLYAAGGFDASGAPNDSLEFLDLLIVSDQEQVAGGWTTSAQVLSEARAQCAGFGVDYTLFSVVPPGQSWVYFAGGTDDGSDATGTVDAGEVVQGGDLSPWQPIDALSPGRAGFAYAGASNFLYGFGGQNAAPSKNGVSGELVQVALPDVQNWNSLGTSLSTDRYLPGSAQESAVIFVIGGQTDTEAASASVDWTNF